MSEYLSEEEQVARMKSWWDENGTTVIVTVVVTVAALAGWNWYGSYQEDQTYAASDAYVAYSEADTADKATMASALGEQFPGSAYHILVLFSQAQDAQQQGDLAGAEAYLAEVLESGDEPLLLDLAKVRLAKLQQAQDRSSEALSTLSTITSEGYRPWALEAKGDVHVSRGELQLAHEAYTAALESLGEGAERPILEMKMHNVAPADGEYVVLSDGLSEALQAAQETLAAEPAAADVVSDEGPDETLEETLEESAQAGNDTDKDSDNE